jgi:SAM-dependent methyltransferase
MARVDYDQMAPDYVEGRALPPEGMEPWREAIRPWLTVEGAGRSPVLDLGAGTGQFAAAIAGWFGVEVVAVEPSRGMRAQAAQAHPHPGVTWVAGVGERLPLGDATCAWAWVSTVVHHLDDLDAAAGELGRVLRPGGLVLVRQAFPGRMGAITLYRRFFPGAGATLVTGGGLPTVERVSEAFAGAGFGVEGLEAVDQVSATSLAAYRDKVRRRADTGLRLLPDDQFAAGLAALEEAAEAETDPTPVVDRIDLLVLRRPA